MNEEINLNKKINEMSQSEQLDSKLSESELPETTLPESNMPERMTDGDPEIENKEEAFLKATGVVYYDEEGNQIKKSEEEKDNTIYDDTQK
ncbi:MAG: hypothetical protein KBB88_03535 [Candidatus Pacebacteria bacterium]|nr:hypothetical protein [Candidatus Paceibacterota bacterium]